MFKGMQLEEFNQTFKTEEVCKQYLFDLKWKNLYTCRRCSHTNFWKGRTHFHARCAACGYDESITSHTVFHKMQIPLLKAFRMVFQISVLKKGISSLELSKIFGIDEKTAFRFRERVHSAMASWISKECAEKRNVKVTRLDSVLLMNRGEKLNGLQRLNLIMEEYTRGKSKLNVIRLIGLVPFSNVLDQCHLVAGRYVDERKSILVWNLKCWLTGTHHHCSEKNLQNYINEFLFRYNNRHRQEEIWQLLINQMMLSKPRYLSSNAA